LLFVTKVGPPQLGNIEKGCLLKGMCWRGTSFQHLFRKHHWEMWTKSSSPGCPKGLHLPLSTVWSHLHLPSCVLQKTPWSIQRTSLSSHPKGKNP